MSLLVLDTATPATVVGVLGAGGEVLERRHDPQDGERPGHAAEVLSLAHDALVAAGIGWDDVTRVGAGVGPGSFTGLRIGVSTARALAQSAGAELVAVSTLEALAVEAAGERAGCAVLAVLDARRGEAFAAGWRDGRALGAPVAVAPAGLAALVARLGTDVVAVGDGALRFRAELEGAGATVPGAGSPRHRVSAAGLCRVAAGAAPVAREDLVPDYVRDPDARPREVQA